jgi:hypothetical protein
MKREIIRVEPLANLPGKIQGSSFNRDEARRHNLRLRFSTVRPQDRRNLQRTN